MDYSNSTNWLGNSTSLELVLSNGGSTLPLFDDSPVRDNSFKKAEAPSDCSTEVASRICLNKDEAGTLAEELNRVNRENKKLTEMLTVVCENYNDLKRKLMDYMNSNTATAHNEVTIASLPKKRRVENFSNNINGIIGNNNVEGSSSDEEDSYGKPKELETVKAKITKVAVRTEASDSSLILKDGYHWRKYGQKVTRDNPCPRAYFKCSFAPSCPVKKKVQRSLEDQSMLVATYEGEHNHAPPAQHEANPSSSRNSAIPTIGSSGSTVTLDVAETKPSLKSNDICTPATLKILNNASCSHAPTIAQSQSQSQAQAQAQSLSQAQAQLMKLNSSDFQKVLAEQMAYSLTKDPKFTAALAAAISGKFIRQ